MACHLHCTGGTVFAQTNFHSSSDSPKVCGHFFFSSSVWLRFDANWFGQHSTFTTRRKCSLLTRLTNETGGGKAKKLQYNNFFSARYLRFSREWHIFDVGSCFQACLDVESFWSGLKTLPLFSDICSLSFFVHTHSFSFRYAHARVLWCWYKTDDVDFIDQGTEKFLFVWVCTYPIREKNETPLNPLALSLANDFIMCFFLSFDVEHSLQFFLFLLLCLALVYIPSKTKIFHIDAIWSLANCWPKIDTFVRSDTRLQAFTNSLKLRCQFSEQSPQIRSTTTFIVGPIAVSTGNCSFLMDSG